MWLILVQVLICGLNICLSLSHLEINHLDAFSLSLTFSFIFSFSLLFFISFPSPSHLPHVLHISKAIFIKLVCLLISGLRNLNLEKRLGAPKLRRATYRFKSVDFAQTLYPKEIFWNFKVCLLFSKL